MICLRSFLTVTLLLTTRALPIWAQQGDIFDFFEEEAQVVSASLRPQPICRAPATVYVVTGEDIQAFGAQTLWDALRGVPGVDVMNTRTFQGEVSIRGLNKSVNNRTLVLLDGKTVLNGFFENVTWEAIPVTLAEVDRIEVVEGPASALYGANAVNGVINIITRTPEQLSGGTVSYTVGERETHLGRFVYGDPTGEVSYKIGVGWRSTNRFEDAGIRASEVFKLHAMLEYDDFENARICASGGIAHHTTQITAGGSAVAIDDGDTGFTRVDFAYRNTRFRAFWNRGKTFLKEMTIFGEPRISYDTYDLNLEQTLNLPFQNSLVVGAGYRRSKTQPHAGQDLWALFFEDMWRPTPRLTFFVSGRLDRHPMTGLMFSPRGSVIFQPALSHTLRLSAGTSFRNPTLTENFWTSTQTIPNSGTILPNPPFTEAELTFLVNRDLVPEQMRTVDAAYNGGFGRVRVTAAGFHYRLKDTIFPTPVELVSAVPPTIRLELSFVNKGDTRAWGGELGAEVVLNDHARAFVNYSYQRITGELDAYVSEEGGPMHKANGGIRFTRGGLTASAWVHRVGQTAWNKTINPIPSIYARVAGYTLLNTHIGYAFSRRLRGLSAGVSAFNLTDHPHFQTLPVQGELEPGQNGEVIRRRVTVTLAYAF